MAFSYILSRKPHTYSLSSSLTFTLQKQKHLDQLTHTVLQSAFPVYKFWVSFCISKYFPISPLMKKGFSTTCIYHNFCTPSPDYWALKLFLVYDYHKQSHKKSVLKIRGLFACTFCRSHQNVEMRFSQVLRDHLLPILRHPTKEISYQVKNYCGGEKATDRNMMSTRTAEARTTAYRLVSVHMLCFFFP